MKIFLAFTISLFLNQRITSHQAHPLYVSMTDITHNTGEQSVEIISKIFLDDLEAAILKKYNEKIDLFATPTDASKKLLLKYMQATLKISINNQLLNYTIIGYERKKDACWVYLEIPAVKTCSAVTVSNSILHDYSSKQINLLTVNVGNDSKSHKLSYPDTQKSFSF